MTTFLLILQAIIGAVLVAVILMQQSEGGGLGMGGSPSGLMSARGAADFLTRATAILATVFVALSIVQAVRATRATAPVIDTTLARPATALPPPAAGLPSEPLAPANGASNAAVPLVPLATERPVTQTQPTPPPVAPRVTRERTTPTDQPRPVRTPRPTTGATTGTGATPPTVTPTPTPAPATTAPSVPIGGGNSN